MLFRHIWQPATGWQALGGEHTAWEAVTCKDRIPESNHGMIGHSAACPCYISLFAHHPSFSPSTHRRSISPSERLSRFVPRIRTKRNEHSFFFLNELNETKRILTGRECHHQGHESSATADLHMDICSKLSVLQVTKWRSQSYHISERCVLRSWFMSGPPVGWRHSEHGTHAPPPPFPFCFRLRCITTRQEETEGGEEQRWLGLGTLGPWTWASTPWANEPSAQERCIWLPFYYRHFARCIAQQVQCCFARHIVETFATSMMAGGQRPRWPALLPRLHEEGVCVVFTLFS